MRIAILSNVTVEVLAGLLRKQHSLWLPSGFGGWMETALSIPNELREFDPQAFFLLLDSSHAKYDHMAAEIAIAALEKSFPHAAVLVPDLEDLADEVGAFYDERMWALASMPWSMKGLYAIVDEMNRLIRAMLGNRKKVLALDLDNTLWRGVIGEDGVSGIEPFAEFQEEILALRKRGVLLVVLSKNNAADVLPVWDDPRMVLKKRDFADMRIDWNDKSANLKKSASMLNLGTDSFVFVDDNPAERLRLSAQCPEVAVADWPVNMRRLSRLYFPKMRVTAEDRVKTEQYQAESMRKELASTMSFEDYIKALEIRTDIHPIRPSEIQRVAQLSQKTNQFNVCTNRYTEEDVQRFANDSSRLIVTVCSRDRFGDQGLIAFVQVVLSHEHGCERGKICQIVDWVMSCRAMNRRIEFSVQQWVEKELRRRGVCKMLAVWKRTAKNAPVRNLFESFSFKVIHSTEEAKSYERVLG